MPIPTVGELRFQAQLLNALDELAAAIRENTGALRELAGILQSTAMATGPEGDGHPVPQGPPAHP